MKASEARKLSEESAPKVTEAQARRYREVEEAAARAADRKQAELDERFRIKYSAIQARIRVAAETTHNHTIDIYVESHDDSSRILQALLDDEFNASIEPVERYEGYCNADGAHAGYYTHHEKVYRIQW